MCGSQPSQRHTPFLSESTCVSRTMHCHHVPHSAGVVCPLILFFPKGFHCLENNSWFIKEQAYFNSSILTVSAVLLEIGMADKVGWKHLIELLCLIHCIMTAL